MYSTATHLCVWCLYEREPPEQVDESQFSLQHCKPHTNTVPWPVTKWDITQWRALGLLLRGKPVYVCSN